VETTRAAEELALERLRRELRLAAGFTPVEYVRTGFGGLAYHRSRTRVRGHYHWAVLTKRETTR